MALTAKAIFGIARWFVPALMTTCICAAQPDLAPNSSTLPVQVADSDKPAADGSGAKAKGIIQVGPGSPRTPQALNGKSAISSKQGEQEEAFIEAQGVAKQMLQNLDQVIEIAQSAGIAAPPSWVSTSQGLDPYSQKRVSLRGQLDQARDQLSATAVASQTAMAMSEILQAIAVNTSRCTTGPSGSVTDRNGSPRLTAIPIVVSLCMAGASLIISFLALWRGWFVARRHVDKALTDAGLL